MKIIYEYENDYAGMAAVQIEPQTRTIGSHYGFRRLHFPYILKIISYEKFDGKFIYNGIFKLGLSVYFSSKPAKLKTKISVPPMMTNSYGNYGLICTPHPLDASVFKTRDELILFASDLWWQIEHNPFTSWLRVQSPEEMLKVSNDLSAVNGHFAATLEKVLEFVKTHSVDYKFSWNVSWPNGYPSSAQEFLISLTSNKFQKTFWNQPSKLNFELVDKPFEKRKIFK